MTVDGLPDQTYFQYHYQYYHVRFVQSMYFTIVVSDL